MAKKTPISADRFMVEDDIPLYKRAAGMKAQQEEKPVEPKPKKDKPKKSSPGNDLAFCMFRLRPDQIEDLGIFYAKTRANVSGMVRDALEAYLIDYLSDKITKVHIPLELNQTPGNALETKGIRLSPRLIEAVGIVAVSNGVNRSEIVRFAIDEYLAKKDA